MHRISGPEHTARVHCYSAQVRARGHTPFYTLSRYDARAACNPSARSASNCTSSVRLSSLTTHTQLGHPARRRWPLREAASPPRAASPPLREAASPPRALESQPDSPGGSGQLSLAGLAECLLAAGDEVVGAGAVLGHHQKLSENPGSLAGAGCSLANAGRHLQSAGVFVAWTDEQNGNWHEALADASREMLNGANHFAPTGAESLDTILSDCADRIEAAAEALDSARFICCSSQGRWMVDDACASLVEGAELLQEAAADLGEYGSAMVSEGGIYAVAGEHTNNASVQLAAAGEHLSSLGEALAEVEGPDP